jgi:hypothetical protein
LAKTGNPMQKQINPKKPPSLDISHKKMKSLFINTTIPGDRLKAEKSDRTKKESATTEINWHQPKDS